MLLRTACDPLVRTVNVLGCVVGAAGPTAEGGHNVQIATAHHGIALARRVLLAAVNYGTLTTRQVGEAAINAGPVVPGRVSGPAGDGAIGTQDLVALSDNQPAVARIAVVISQHDIMTPGARVDTISTGIADDEVSQAGKRSATANVVVGAAAPTDDVDIDSADGQIRS